MDIALELEPGFKSLEILRLRVVVVKAATRPRANNPEAINILTPTYISREVKRRILMGSQHIFGGK